MKHKKTEPPVNFEICGKDRGFKVDSVDYKPKAQNMERYSLTVRELGGGGFDAQIKSEDAAFLIIDEHGIEWQQKRYKGRTVREAVLKAVKNYFWVIKPKGSKEE